MNVQAMHNFQRNLRSAMKLAGLSQRMMAEKAGFSYPYVNRVLQGKAEPTLPVCDAFADALGVELSELISDPKRRSKVSA